MEEQDDEAQRLEELRQIKRARLHELDKQAGRFGIGVPPHIQTEREQLRRELGIVESVIASPLSAQIGDELGESSRFVAYIELMRQGDRATQEAVARLEEKVNAGFERFGRTLAQLATHLQTVDTRSQEHDDRSDAASMQWRRIGTGAFIVIIVIIVAMLIVGFFWLGRLTSGQALVRGLLPLMGR